MIPPACGAGLFFASQRVPCSVTYTLCPWSACLAAQRRCPQGTSFASWLAFCHRRSAAATDQRAGRWVGDVAVITPLRIRRLFWPKWRQIIAAMLDYRGCDTPSKKTPFDSRRKLGRHPTCGPSIGKSEQLNSCTRIPYIIIIIIIIIIIGIITSIINIISLSPTMPHRNGDSGRAPGQRRQTGAAWAFFADASIY